MKLKRHYIIMACAVILLISGTANAQPQPPVLSVTNGSWVYLSWSEVKGATGYPVLCANALYGSGVYREYGYGNSKKRVRG